MIVFTSNYRAKVQRTLQRFIICEKCGCEFTFIAGATGTARRSDELEAVETAITEAHQQIALAAAPCPECGWYQRSMLKGLRLHHHGWLRQLGLAVLAAVGCVLLAMVLGYDSPSNGESNLQTVDELIVYVAGPLGLLLFGVHWVIASRYHPNAIWPKRPPPRKREPRAVPTLEYRRRVESSTPQVWYVFKDQRKTGPFSREQLIADLRAGTVLLTDHVWSEGMDGWRVAEKGLVVLGLEPQ